MKKASLFTILLLSVWGMACVTVQKGKTSKDDLYSEDLTNYLPSEPVDTLVDESEGREVALVDSTLDIQQRLDSALYIVDNYINGRTKYIEGLSIQLYAGSDRSEAREAQMKAYRYFPEASPRIIFDQPNYKVRMGSFYTQLEAYALYRSVQERFPKAILVPTRIPITGK